MSKTLPKKFDYIIVGGGLQGSLIVKALRYQQPNSSILLIEQGEKLCGNHTWSFHAGDIPECASNWVQTLPVKSWQGYSVLFPGFKRELALRYCSMQSDAVRQSIHDMESDCRKITKAAETGTLSVLTRTAATAVNRHSVNTADGRVYRAHLVIDCRGVTRDEIGPGLRCGYQKFHGFEIELPNDWPDKKPVLMDSRVSQADGFRFLYVLPLDNRRVLIEDTCFSDSWKLHRDDCLRDLEKYLSDRSVGKFEIVREERGCLPMPYSKGMEPRITDPLRGGYSGGWFHAATGFSFPLAVSFAHVIASTPPQEAPRQILRLADQNRFQAKFARFLNRLLFRAVRPEDRWRIFRRFYRVLPNAAIERFYAHRFTKIDAARMIIGTPPQGLTPVRFLHSFEASPCLATHP